MTLPTIGITLGDPGGIGPEVSLKALENNPQRSVSFGDGVYKYKLRAYLDDDTETSTWMSRFVVILR